MLENILIIPIKVFPTFSPMFSMGFWGSGGFFSVNCQARTGKKLWEKYHGTRKFDAKHSSFVASLAI